MYLYSGFEHFKQKQSQIEVRDDVIDKFKDISSPERMERAEAARAAVVDVVAGRASQHIGHQLGRLDARLRDGLALAALAAATEAHVDECQSEVSLY